MTRHGPPGWAPHQAMSQIDGWTIIDPENEDRAPPAVAALIVQNMPSLSGDDTVADIRARMQARQNMLTQQRRFRRVVNRMMRFRHA